MLDAYIYAALRTPFGRQAGEDSRYVVISLCIGVGQGLAVVIERL